MNVNFVELLIILIAFRTMEDTFVSFFFKNLKCNIEATLIRVVLFIY